MEATAVVPVTNVEEQPIGGVVCLAHSSPVVDEVVECDDVAGDDAAALARAAGANLMYRANTGHKDPKGEQMKTATKTVTALLGMLCLLVMAGCPKKAVLSSQPSEMRPEPVEEDHAAGFR